MPTWIMRCVKIPQITNIALISSEALAYAMYSYTAPWILTFEQETLY